MAHDFSTLSTLFDVIESRKGGDPGASYVAGLLKDGKGKIARKLGEEAIESMVAALADGKEALVAESADLLFHLMVLWAACDVTPDDVMAELKRREGTSGLEEKKRRRKKAD
jgi:phosphoribosyl-ATP pyrophosphohydrolase